MFDVYKSLVWFKVNLKTLEIKKTIHKNPYNLLAEYFVIYFLGAWRYFKQILRILHHSNLKYAAKIS